MNNGHPYQHPAIRPAWLATQQEDVLDPEQVIIDSHQHVWDRPGWRYLWDDLLADLASGHNVRASVYVQANAMFRAKGPEAMKPVGETEFVNGLAAMSASGQYGRAELFAGIVGYADLLLGDAVRPVLDAHVAVSGGPASAGGRFRGIRYVASWDPNPGLQNPAYPSSEDTLSNPVFRAGLSHLHPLGLTFETYLFFPQIPHLTALARAFPELPIVLNHCGGIVRAGAYAPPEADVFSRWSAALRDLATCPNVMVKLGGLAMRVSAFGFEARDRAPGSLELADAWRPWMQTCIETFGPTRCMFESNFPVDKTGYSYRVFWNAAKRIAQGATREEKDDLFWRSAARFYCLNPDASGQN